MWAVESPFTTFRRPKTEVEERCAEDGVRGVEKREEEDCWFSDHESVCSI